MTVLSPHDEIRYTSESSQARLVKNAKQIMDTTGDRRIIFSRYQHTTIRFLHVQYKRTFQDTTPGETKFGRTPGIAHDLKGQRKPTLYRPCLNASA